VEATAPDDIRARTRPVVRSAVRDGEETELFTPVITASNNPYKIIIDVQKCALSMSFNQRFPLLSPFCLLSTRLANQGPAIVRLWLAAFFWLLRSIGWSCRVHHSGAVSPTLITAGRSNKPNQTKPNQTKPNQTKPINKQGMSATSSVSGMAVSRPYISSSSSSSFSTYASPPSSKFN